MEDLTFTPDGCELVSGSFDKTLKYWDISHLANGPGSQPNLPGASKRGIFNKKDVGTRESNLNTCTMNFVGHKVRVELDDCGCV